MTGVRWEERLPAESSPSFDRLTYGRTVERGWVHRAAVSEVFITDLADIDSEQTAVAAQLPVGHGYFLDTAGAPRYGIALLGECARQASTAVAHRRAGVPAGWTFLMMSTSFRLYGAAPPPVGPRPAQLAMLVRMRREHRAGAVRAVDSTIDLWLGGEPVAQATGRTRLVTGEEYEFLRSDIDEVAPLTSDALPEPPGGTVAPALVGRRDPRNVLVADVRRDGDTVRARLAISGRHPTIFDHPLDHYPGSALIEAASQVARILVGAGPAQVGFRADFGRFAVLDAPIELTGQRAEAGCAVEVSQHGRPVATVTVDLAPAPAGEELAPTAPGRPGTASARSA